MKPWVICPALNKLGMVSHICSPSTQEMEAGRLGVQSSSLATQLARDQPRIHDTLSQKEEKEEEEKNKGLFELPVTGFSAMIT